MKAKVVISLFLMIFNISSYAQTCQEYEIQISNKEAKLDVLEINLFNQSKQVGEEERFVSDSLARVKKSNKPLRITIKVASGVVSVASAYFAIRMLRGSTYETERAFGGILSTLSLSTGAFTVNGIYNYFASREDLEKAQANLKAVNLATEKQKLIIKAHKKVLEAIKKKYHKKC